MKSIPITRYLFVGTRLRYLQDVREGYKVYGAGAVLANIGSFFKSLDELGMLVTKRASYELETFQKEISQKPPDTRLTSEEAKRLGDIMDEIRHTFEAEAKGILTYVVTEKRLDLKKLLENIGELFRPEVFFLCPEIAQYDFREAGLCIAFERPTAAAFHLLRGTESVIRKYCHNFFKSVPNGLTWGQMTSSLKGKLRGKKPDPRTLQNLDNIRNNYRNPTQHPDLIYDIHEAQDLFGLTIDVVNHMIIEIKKDKEKNQKISSDK